MAGEVEGRQKVFTQVQEVEQKKRRTGGILRVIHVEVIVELSPRAFLVVVWGQI